MKKKSEMTFWDWLLDWLWGCLVPRTFVRWIFVILWTAGAFWSVSVMSDDKNAPMQSTVEYPNPFYKSSTRVIPAKMDFAEGIFENKSLAVTSAYQQDFLDKKFPFVFVEKISDQMAIRFWAVDERSVFYYFTFSVHQKSGASLIISNIDFSENSEKIRVEYERSMKNWRLGACFWLSSAFFSLYMLWIGIHFDSPRSRFWKYEVEREKTQEERRRNTEELKSKLEIS